MSQQIGDDRRNPAARRKFSIGWALGLGILVANGMPAHASLIRRAIPGHTSTGKSGVAVHAQSTSGVAGGFSSWDAYFANALATHSLHVVGPNAIKMLSGLSISSVGAAPTPFVEYLRWRRGLSVKRFDSFHPGVAPLLQRFPVTATTAIPPLAPRPSTPATSNPTGPSVPILPPDFTPAPGFVDPPKVPEPSSALIAAILVGGVAVVRRRSQA